MRKMRYFFISLLLVCPILLGAQKYFSRFNSNQNQASFAAQNQTSDENQTLNLSSHDFGISGPLSISSQYSKELGLVISGQFVQLLTHNTAIAAALEHGANQQRLSGTFGCGLNLGFPQRLKITAEQLRQNLDFNFSSGLTKQWITQNAYGLDYDFFLSRGFFRDLNLNAFYSNAGNKNLDSKIFIGADNNIYENFRHIAGGTDRSVSLGLDLQPTQTALIGLELNSDNIKYAPIYDSSIKDVRGLGATISLEQLLGKRAKLKLSASSRKIYDDYAVELDWLPPGFLHNHLELALAGNRVTGNQTQLSYDQVILKLIYHFPDRSIDNKSTIYTLDLPNMDEPLKEWTETPAVYMKQVLALVDQKSVLVLPPKINITDRVYTYDQKVDENITASITFGASKLLSVEAPALANYGLSMKLSPDGKTVTLSGTPNKFVEKVPIKVRVVNFGGLASEGSFLLTIGSVPGTTPKIKDITPKQGSVNGGTTVTITGNDFAPGAIVKFNGLNATNVTVTDPQTITCTTPAHAAGVVAVSVTNPDQKSDSKANAYTYAYAPSVTLVNPNHGPANGGTPVTITGNHFATSGTVTVKFNGAAATDVNVTSSTTLTCKTPAHAAGAVTVTVINPDTQSGGKANAFTYDAAPSVTSVSPDTGTTMGGTAVTVHGENFVNGATVTFLNNPATNVVFVSPQEIQCVTPKHDLSPGPVTVTVTNPDGQFGKKAAAFKYQAPQVDSVNPDSGLISGGTPVTISGDYFFTGATVQFDNVNATNVTFIDTQHITCVTPAHAAGKVKVTVTNTDGYSGAKANAFTYVASPPAPQVTSVDPNKGTTMGGETVTVHGQNFVAGATVTFGGVAAYDVVFISSTEIRCKTPSSDGADVKVKVRVTNPDTQYGEKNNAFWYQFPEVKSASPSSGSVAGLISVTITGDYFSEDPISHAPPTVTFGGTPATTVTVVDAQTITCTNPAHAAGKVDVTVENPNGDSGSKKVFTYNP